jgi:hypothetical protein
VTLYFVSLIGPICPHLIDLFRIAFFVPILPAYR